MKKRKMWHLKLYKLRKFLWENILNITTWNKFSRKIYSMYLQVIVKCISFLNIYKDLRYAEKWKDMAKKAFIKYKFVE